ncbi:hypothetical protein GGR28_003501 [Lewinella aquimaris]|uniref:Uncharacterized protein n=1 Tax=Neolewinella aquimaris TaxID=1835722 RepID=A0A840EAX4_9BACT|nr:hypothetical protein [Neolewinella aquimaris]MBB4080862.1 hypothetical protein [Neolewinella aquimaris]
MMKQTMILLLLFLPLLATAQAEGEYLVFENVQLTPNPAHITEFEAGLAAHNKKYHGEGPYAARTYLIANGPRSSSYLWVMGPFPWSSLDDRPAQPEGHDADWNENVHAYLMDGGEASYLKFHPELSHFPKDFTVNKLLVDFYDIKRFKSQEARELIKPIQKMMMEKFPDDTYGIYTNEFPSTKDGLDMAFISFFEKSAWLGEDPGFAEKYNEVHGEGSFEKFLTDWEAVTDGVQTELWTFLPDLSGVSGEVPAAERQ